MDLQHLWQVWELFPPNSNTSSYYGSSAIVKVSGQLSDSLWNSGCGQDCATWGALYPRIENDLRGEGIPSAFWKAGIALPAFDSLIRNYSDYSCLDHSKAIYGRRCHRNGRQRGVGSQSGSMARCSLDARRFWSYATGWRCEWTKVKTPSYTWFWSSSQCPFLHWARRLVNFRQINHGVRAAWVRLDYIGCSKLDMYRLGMSALYRWLGTSSKGLEQVWCVVVSLIQSHPKTYQAIHVFSLSPLPWFENTLTCSQVFPADAADEQEQRRQLLHQWDACHPGTTT